MLDEDLIPEKLPAIEKEVWTGVRTQEKTKAGCRSTCLYCALLGKLNTPCERDCRLAQQK